MPGPTGRSPRLAQRGARLARAALGREQGFDLFDFGGAGRPDEHYGPREFKAKFGGELVDFGRDVLVHTPMRLRLSRPATA